MAEATAYLFDSPSKQHKTGTFPVMLKVTHDRKRKYFKTGFACLQEQWNRDRARFNRKYGKDYKQDNDSLDQMESKARKIIRTFEVQDQPFNFRDFKNAFERKSNNTLLLPYFHEHIARLLKEGRVSTAAPYEQALSAIKQFNPQAAKAKLTDVTPSFLLDFEHFLKGERNLKDTSISVYMRALRALLNRAIDEGLLKRDAYPFDQYKLGERLNTSTAKRAITKEEVSLIKDLPLVEEDSLYLARDIFLFSYYTRGMNFADIAYLTPENIDGDILNYIRKKTKKSFSIRLLPPAKQIVEYYLERNDKAGDYIFPIFDDTVHITEKQKFNRRKTALKKINKDLKEIAAMIGREGLKLTTYVSRHTYATVVKQSGASVTHISEALGHSSEKTTQTYLKSFGDDVLSEIDKKALT